MVYFMSCRLYLNFFFLEKEKENNKNKQTKKQLIGRGMSRIGRFTEMECSLELPRPVGRCWGDGEGVTTGKGNRVLFGGKDVKLIVVMVEGSVNTVKTAEF